jgi:hypothetical protein
MSSVIILRLHMVKQTLYNLCCDYTFHMCSHIHLRSVLENHLHIIIYFCAQIIVKSCSRSKDDPKISSTGEMAWLDKE